MNSKTKTKKYTYLYTQFTPPIPNPTPPPPQHTRNQTTHFSTFEHRSCTYAGPMTPPQPPPPQGAATHTKSSFWRNTAGEEMANNLCLPLSPAFCQWSTLSPSGKYIPCRLPCRGELPDTASTGVAVHSFFLFFLGVFLLLLLLCEAWLMTYLSRLR